MPAAENSSAMVTSDFAGSVPCASADSFALASAHNSLGVIDWLSILERINVFARVIPIARPDDCSPLPPVVGAAISDFENHFDRSSFDLLRNNQTEPMLIVDGACKFNLRHDVLICQRQHRNYANTSSTVMLH